MLAPLAALNGALPARIGHHVISVEASGNSDELLDAMNTRNRADEEVALRAADVDAAWREYSRRAAALQATRLLLTESEVNLATVVGESGLTAPATSTVIFTMAAVPAFASRAGVAFEVAAALRAAEEMVAELERASAAVAALALVDRVAPLRSDALGRTHALNTARRVLSGAMEPAAWAAAVLAPVAAAPGAGAGADAGGAAADDDGDGDGDEDEDAGDFDAETDAQLDAEQRALDEQCEQEEQRRAAPGGNAEPAAAAQ